jgi:hypothetical protein
MESGPKRRYYEKEFRLYTNDGIPTSVSVGGGIRVNVGSRGTRASVRNPLTGKSQTLWSGRRLRSSSSLAAKQVIAQEGRWRRGCGCVPIVGVLHLNVIVLLII